MEPQAGVEPATICLQNRRTAIVLLWLKMTTPEKPLLRGRDGTEIGGSLLVLPELGSLSLCCLRHLISLANSQKATPRILGALLTAHTIG